jgi:type I restriction enzyme, S subunit
MNSAQLLTHFHRLAEAPDAVPRLRHFIFDLAVRGKLVPQDPKDEPAAKLLQRIQAEKERLVKEGKLKKTEPASPAKDSDCPLRLPTGWVAARLQSLCLSVTDGDHLPPPKAEVGVPFLVIGNVRDQTIQFAGCRHVEDSYYNSLDPIRRPKKGDLLYTLVGSYGIPVLVRDDRPFCVQRHIGILRPSETVDVEFLGRALSSEFVFEQATTCATGIAQKTVPLSGLRKMIIPLPPLAEQRRIVAKVTELMGLCDRLEAAQADREQRRDRLAAATHAGLSTPEPLHSSFFLRQFPQFTTRPDQIPQLRQTILNLAVRGQLVPHSQKARMGSLESILAEASVNGVSKGPTPDANATKILRISAGTSRRDFYVDENDFKHVNLSAKEVEQFKLHPGDLLACRFNGNLHYVGMFSYYRGESGEIQVNPDKLIRFRINTELHDPRYVCFAMNAADTRQSIEAMCATSVGNIGLSAGKLKTVEIPLPPLAEQRRIVAKVEELMALCDQMETQLHRTQTESRRLLASVLHEALAA